VTRTPYSVTVCFGKSDLLRRSSQSAVEVTRDRIPETRPCPASVVLAKGAGIVRSCPPSRCWYQSKMGQSSASVRIVGVVGLWGTVPFIYLHVLTFHIQTALSSCLALDITSSLTRLPQHTTVCLSRNPKVNHTASLCNEAAGKRAPARPAQEQQGPEAQKPD
jgi:hypothetical protein